MSDSFNTNDDVKYTSEKTAKDYEAIGRSCIAVKDFEGAEAAFQVAIQLDENAGWYRKDLSRALEGQGRLDEAFDVLNGLSLQDSHQGDAQLSAMIGSLKLKQKNLVDAESAFRKAVQLDPSVNWYKNALADILAKVGSLDEALSISTELSQAESHAADANLQARIGMLHLRKGEVADAEAAFAKSITLDPKVAWVHRALAEALGRQGKFGEAISVLRHALVIDPDHLESSEKLSSLLSLQEAKQVGEPMTGDALSKSRNDERGLSISPRAMPAGGQTGQKKQPETFWGGLKKFFGG